MYKFLEVVIPEEVNGYYVLPTTLVGVTIKQEVINATIIFLKGSTISIEKIISEPLDNSQEQTPATIATALTLLFKKIGSYSHVTLSIQSSAVIFKDMSFSFADPEKIAMIIPFEVESMLPFAPHEAYLDFITTKTSLTEPSTTVIAAAIQKKWITESLAPFEQASIEVSRVTTDTIALYGLCKRSAALQTGIIGFVHIDSNVTTIGLMVDGQLKQIRTLKKGSRLGGNLSDVWKDIGFTLNTFIQEVADDAALKEVIVFNVMTPNIIDLCKQYIQAPCKEFNPETLFTASNIHAKKTIDLNDSLSLAAALPCIGLRNFSFLPPLFSKTEQTRLTRQTIAGICLPFIALLLLAIHTFKEIHIFSEEVATSQKQILKILKENFSTISTNNLRDALETAQREVKREEDIWSSLSSQNRQSFLHYLHELSTKIDRETLGLNLKKMIINKNTINLEGNVRSFEAVEQFEHQLRETKLFSIVPDMQKVEFTVQLPLQLQERV